MKSKTEYIMTNLMNGSKFVYQTSRVQSMTFMEVKDWYNLTRDSQPFIGDLNGDMIDDIIFNNANNDNFTNAGQGRLNVAIFMPNKNEYDIHNFKNALVDEDCGGLTSQIENPLLSTPHSVAMPDFDGDCMSDLFITVEDEKDGSNKAYEIYIRREQNISQTDSSGMIKTPSSNFQNSFCLVQYDDISQIQNNNLFEFADIDRDGFIDMLFLTDKKTMNFIVAYNMLKPTNLYADAPKTK